MDLEELKLILNSNLPKNDKEFLIIKSLSMDENVIPAIMIILESERKIKEEILTEMNVLLSKADVGLDDNKFNTNNFMQKEILEFYTKYKDYKGVGHCFKKLFDK